jgi:hypothetical protein
MPVYVPEVPFTQFPNLFLSNPNGEMRSTTARFKGKCKATGEPFEAGTTIYKVEGVGWCTERGAAMAMGEMEPRENPFHMLDNPKTLSESAARRLREQIARERRIREKGIEPGSLGVKEHSEWEGQLMEWAQEKTEDLTRGTKRRR